MTVPNSTYRLQFHSGLNFDSAIGALEYLAELGISHVYCSPYLQAAPGSTHGYDTIDYHRVSSELGGAEGLARFRKKLRELGLAEILDIVPNHMAIVGNNVWWWDTLENGMSGRYAPYFDIDWNAPEERLRNQILLPVLGDHYGRVLDAGEITLARHGGSFAFRYHEHMFPVAPESCDRLLGAAAERCGSKELGFLADALAQLALRKDHGGWVSRLEHHRNKEVIRELLARLCAEDSEVAKQVDAEVARVNQSSDASDALLSRQNYRLSRWRSAERELIYRRFFDINSLVGIRTEDERVFEDTHQLILAWLQGGELDGVRVDHPDGLSDPEEYLLRLRHAAPNAWIVVEKILQPTEALPPTWDIAGTTGYDFLNLVGGLFIDPRGEAPLNELYRDFTGEPVDFSLVARSKKALVLREVLGSDINRVTSLFVQICEQHREHRDYTRHEIHEAIREVAVCLPVYRTYVSPSADKCSESDTRYVSEATLQAKAARPDLDERLFDFLREVLLLRVRGAFEDEFAARFQQITAAAMAKGIEDTAFYCYSRLVSLNEVGGDPGRFGTSIDEFHKRCCETQRLRPFTMLTTSTHDTKRSEDVRARINVLSEVPGIWSEAVRRWATMNSRHRTTDLPDRKTEYLLYQTLVGTWPISKDRLIQYMRKAAREAKEHTSWIAPNETFEAALETFLDGILADADFISDFEAFLNPLLQHARIASLAAVLLKVTAPGVPDTYQGTEIWDLSLVDPDNRRPVDFGHRKKLLCLVPRLTPEQIIERSNEGLPKLWVLRQALRTRNERRDSFGAEGSSQPLWPSGPKAEHLVAFQRGDDVITIVPRLLMSLGTWDTTSLEIPEGLWKNQFTGDVLQGGKLEAEALLKRFPVALLTREPGAVDAGRNA